MALNKSDSISQVNNLFPDNTTGEITPADQRIVSTNAISSNVNTEETIDQTLQGFVSIKRKLLTVVANYIALITDDFILCDCTTSGFTITLPSAGSSTGRVLNIKRVDETTNVLTIDGSGTETIDQELTQELTSGLPNIKIVSDGIGWWVI